MSVLRLVVFESLEIGKSIEGEEEETVDDVFRNVGFVFRSVAFVVVVETTVDRLKISVNCVDGVFAFS
jgi:hypothetical protein